ncbi:MAG: hypothetical protein NWE96_09545 [Candidatus Bathyarchaeota archaeon]|nr:hypothetical protein [Candidatus Bathyarchaeota archaeon]
MLSLLIKTLGLVSIVLSLVLVYLFFKVYSTQRSVILLGLPLGFLFLSVSFIFLGIHLFFYTIIDTFSSSVMWLRVTTQTCGYSFIALSYFLSGHSQKRTTHNLSSLAIGSILLIASVFGVLLAIYPSGLVSVYSYNLLFTVANLCLISYILFFIIRRLESATENIALLISAPVAFAFLWLGQFSFLITKLDGGDASLIGSQIAPIIGLTILIRIYYLNSKRCHVPVDDQQTQ